MPKRAVSVNKRETQTNLASYKFDTSTYIVLSSSVRRDAKSGRLVEVKEVGQISAKK